MSFNEKIILKFTPTLWCAVTLYKNKITYVVRYYILHLGSLYCNYLFNLKMYNIFTFVLSILLVNLNRSSRFSLNVIAIWVVFLLIVYWIYSTKNIRKLNILDSTHSKSHISWLFIIIFSRHSVAWGADK